MSIDLSPYGWKGCSIREDLRDLRRSLPKWNNLNLLRTSSTLASLRLPHSPLYDTSGSAFMPAYRKGIVYNRGAYSTLYKGGRALYSSRPSSTKGCVDLVLETPLHECAVKEINLHITPAEEAATPHTRHDAYEDEINAALYEAVIHLLVCKTLFDIGHSSFAPSFYECMAEGDMPLDSPTRIRSLWCCMEFLEGTSLDVACKQLLRPLQSATTVEEHAAFQHKNERFLLDIAVQIAFVLHVLQRDLRFHHRDLKLNNVFRRKTPSTQTLVLPSTTVWKCESDLVLLDFGFSCIACGTEHVASPRATLLGAGSWFTPDDDCCKEGRDLAQFLYSLHCHFPLLEYVGDAFYTAFQTAMTATTATGPVSLMNGFTSDGVPVAAGRKPLYHKGIYCFLKRDDVEVPTLVPATFLSSVVVVPKKLTPGVHGP